MIVLALAAALCFPVDSKVSMLNGDTHSGSLVSISESEVALTDNGQDIVLPVDEVMVIEFPSATALASEESQWIVFTDGSQIHATSVSRTAKSFMAQTLLLGQIESKTEEIRAVRLQAENPAYAQQWDTFLKRKSEKDNLVVAKRDGTGLDFLAGIVSSIDSEQVGFLLDGESIPVPAERVYGVVFGRPADSGRDTSKIDFGIQLTSTAGDVVTARSITFSNEQLRLEAGWNQQVSMSAERLQKIDLSSGRIQFLSDMPTLAEQFYGVDPDNSLLAGLINQEQQALLFGPQRNTTIERQSRLRLRGREFAKGLCIHSKTEMKWALDKRFSALECIIGIDDEVAFNGVHAVSVRITGDENVLLEKLVSTTDDPFNVRLQLDGVTSLTILVDFGDGSSVCDWLNLADARLVIAKGKQ